MKKLFIAVMASLACASASAEWVRGPNGIRQWGWPTVLVLDGKTINPATPEDCMAEGYWAETAEEASALAAEQSASQAEADALASLPQTSETGYAVKDANGHWVELVPTGDGLPVVGEQISNSPLDPAVRSAMRAERDARRSALHARAKDKNLNDKEKIAVLMEAVFGVVE